ncbi:MAG: PEP-CTERM sorting domain-containing protein [Lentisphaeria bacterium]
MNRKSMRTGLVVMALAAAVSPAAIMVDGALKVAPSDLDFGQSDGTRSGYDFRWKYAVLEDKYSLNASTSNAFAGTGYAQGTFSNEGIVRTTGVRYFLQSTSTAGGTLVWKFDFSQAGSAANVIDQLQVRATSYAFKGATGGYVTWEVSTDNANWTTFIDLRSSVGTDASDTGYHNLTSYVHGASVYYLRANIHSWQTSGFTDAQIFRVNSGVIDDYRFDNEVWLIPEPTMLGLLAAGGLGLLCRRRGSQTARPGLFS